MDDLEIIEVTNHNQDVIHLLAVAIVTSFHDLLIKFIGQLLKEEST
jgi:hypothetical protein